MIFTIHIVVYGVFLLLLMVSAFFARGYQLYFFLSYLIMISAIVVCDFGFCC